MLKSPLVITLLLFPSLAHADWQYIKWGMSKKAAIEASKGEAIPVQAGKDVVCAFNTQVPFARIPRKSIGGFEFQVTFCTDGGDKVTSVALTSERSANLTLQPHLYRRIGDRAALDAIRTLPCTDAFLAAGERTRRLIVF